MKYEILSINKCTKLFKFFVFYQILIINNFTNFQFNVSTGHHFTIDENIIGILKMRNNYCAIKLFIIQYAILSNIFIDLNLLCFIFGITSLILAIALSCSKSVKEQQL